MERSSEPDSNCEATVAARAGDSDAVMVFRGPMPDVIAAALQSEIISGKYRPGSRLVEREIADRFRVSSIPVREALQILETRGLAVKRPNRGCSVVDLTPEEVEQGCELRDCLEPQVVEWAACRITDTGAERLLGQLEFLKRAAEVGKMADFFYQDLQFHRVIWDVARNQSAARALENVVGSLFACGLRDGDIDLVEQYRRHQRLCNAIVEGRPADAALLLRSISSEFRNYLGRRWQPTARKPAEE